ncbi:MAG: helix-turn-helix domain-containing protein [Lachnospira pectinoschiza]
MHERIVISFKPTVTEWLNNVVGTDIVSDVMQAGVISIPEKRRDYIESLLEKLLFENEGQDPLSPGFVSVALAELMLFITRCKNYEENVIKEIDVNNRIMQEVATYIYNHYSERLILEDVAKKFNLSRSYLSKKFKSVTGFGFKEYIINVRIQHACELLLNTNKSITDIAFECGFNDSNYFGDAFRRTKGISPNKYRKNKEHM